MKGDGFRLKHILEAIEDIERVAARAEWDKDTRTIIMYNLQIIGEASRHISQELKNGHPDLPWPKMYGLRNLIVHEYFDIDEQIIRSIVSNELPTLKSRVAEILSEMQNEL